MTEKQSQPVKKSYEKECHKLSESDKHGREFSEDHENCREKGKLAKVGIAQKERPRIVNYVILYKKNFSIYNYLYKFLSYNKYKLRLSVMSRIILCVFHLS